MSLHKEELENEQNAFENEKVVIHYSTEGKVVTKKTAETVEDEDKDHEEIDEIPFVPHHALKEAIAAVIFLIVAFLFVAFISAPLEDKANSYESPTGVKSEWYLLAAFEVMHLLPPLVGFALQGIFVGLLIMLPFLDRKPGPIMRRRIMFPASLLVLATLLVLTVMAMVKTE
jgi:quinol-cytochrome oxidoreductase complex cytochrome b subunit